MLLASCSIAPLSMPPITVVTEGDNNQVTPVQEDGATIIDVQSPVGIGGADITFLAEPLPAEILLRFHLRGLEDLRFRYGETEIALAVSSMQDRSVRENLVAPDGTETPIEPGDPHWMDVEVVNGYLSPETRIEVTVPPDFHVTEQSRFQIHWIDFYR
jgi:hypothetical protein